MNDITAAIVIQKAWLKWKSWQAAQEVEYERDGYSPEPNYCYEPEYSTCYEGVDY